MRVLKAIQIDEIEDAVRSKFALCIPVLEATLRSLAADRAARFGGYERVTLSDLARETREGSGDAGICFELAVHEAVASRHPLLHPLISQVIEDHCGIREEANSILFGPEKNHVIPVLESTQNSLTDDSRVWVGNRGQPPKLKRYIPQIINAFRRNEARNKLPRCISGLWKADLFIGGRDIDRWLGVSVKINDTALVGAHGLRLGIYPRRNERDVPRRDDALNLIRIPLPYDGAFMESFYKSFFLVRAFIKADARVPPPISLPDAEDRFVTQELERRRDFAVLDVLQVLRDMAQPQLVDAQPIENMAAGAMLSAEGLRRAEDEEVSDLISLSPYSSTAQ